MQVEWNDETKSFDISDVTLEQLNEMREGIGMISEELQMEQALRGTPEFQEVIVDSLNQVYEPLTVAIVSMTDEQRESLPPCQCAHCLINNIKQIRDSAPFN